MTDRNFGCLAVNEFYLNRAGICVRIVGYVSGGNTYFDALDTQYTETGMMLALEDHHARDLITHIETPVFKPKKVKVTKNVEYWANVYRKGLDCYPTKDACDKYAGVDRIACVKMTGTYETEEFDTASAVCAHEWNYFGVCTKCLEKIAPGKCEHKIGITGLCMKCLTNFNVK